jgi:Holliday junction resolvasome RuvABC endonuclease subunit
MAVSSWKKAVIGHGNASKAMVASWVAHNVAVDSQDQADAYCVALAGRDLLASSRRAAA